MMYSFAYFFFFLVWRTSKQGDLKIRSIVKFPYLLYEPIIHGLLPIVFCCIEADTTILVGALFILAYHVKCIPIYLVPLESTYSQRWCPGQQVQLIPNSGVIREKSLQPAAKTRHVFTYNPLRECTSLHIIALHPRVRFPRSLPSCRDSGTPIALRSGIKSTQNSMTSSVTYPLEMLPSGLARL